jgi:hypothetical protein
MLKAYSHAYSAKNCKFPLDILLNLTLFANKDSLNKYIEMKVISIDLSEKETQIIFNKMNSSEINNVKIYSSFYYISSSLANKLFTL